MEHVGRRAIERAHVRSPVVRRRELGAFLRALRTEAGMTVDDVARALLCSPSKVSRMETGQRSPSLRDVRDLCQLYGVTDPQREHLQTLAKESRAPGWWQSYDLPNATYVGLETEASQISDFEPGAYPELLQTADYARAIQESSIPELAPAVMEQRIEVRMTRQMVLTRKEPSPPRLTAIMDEAVLRRIVGRPAVMDAQIEHVIEACELPNVTVQILPFGTGAHPALGSPFILLDFADPLPGVVYVEGLMGNIYLERSSDAERYAGIFEHLQAFSLSQQDSLDLMKESSMAYRNP